MTPGYFSATDRTLLEWATIRNSAADPPTCHFRMGRSVQERSHMPSLSKGRQPARFATNNSHMLAPEMSSSSKPRILVVSDHYSPFLGGAEQQTQLLARELTARGYEIAVATAWHPGLPQEEIDGQITVYRVRQLRTLAGRRTGEVLQAHQPPFPDPVSAWQLRRLIKWFQPDIIHTYGWISYSCALALTGMKTRVLLTNRDYGLICAKRTLLYQDRAACTGPAFTKCVQCAGNHYGHLRGWTTVAGVYVSAPILRRKIQGVHSISAYVHSVLERDFISKHLPGTKDRMLVHRVIPDFKERIYATSENDAEIHTHLNRLPSEPFILYVGALRVVKGIQQLLEAYARLENAPPLVLIGRILRDSPTAYPPGVITLGAFPHQAVMSAWTRCLFGVAPSLLPEPLGDVVFEAMSAGKAMIGTKPGGHADMIVDGETGLLVPSGDVNALFHAMQRLLHDHELRDSLGSKAQTRANQYAVESVLPQLEALYRDISVPELPPYS